METTFQNLQVQECSAKGEVYSDKYLCRFKRRVSNKQPNLNLRHREKKSKVRPKLEKEGLISEQKRKDQNRNR